MKVICISGKAQHGKDTVAACLVESLRAKGKKVLLTHYADLLKYICRTYFDWNGEKDEIGRTILQKVGTEGVRSKDPNFWVNFIVKILQFFPNEWDYVVIPDTRFPNEIEVLRENNIDTILVRVERPGFISPLTVEQQNHPSETSLDDYKYDYVIHNDGTTADLHIKINNFYQQIK